MQPMQPGGSAFVGGAIAQPRRCPLHLRLVAHARVEDGIRTDAAGILVDDVEARGGGRCGPSSRERLGQLAHLPAGRLGKKKVRRCAVWGRCRPPLHRLDETGDELEVGHSYLERNASSDQILVMS